jgi:hypothetical protein
VDIEGRDKGSDFIFVNSSVNSFDGGRFKYAFQDEMNPINPQQSLIFVRWNDHKNSFKNRNLAHHCVLQIYKLRLTLSLGRLMT